MSSLEKYTYFNVSQIQEYVTHIELNRPQKLNSWIRDMWLELRIILNTLSTSPDVRAIIISGAGNRAFTTGLDVQAAGSKDSVLGQAQSQSETTDGARVATALRRHIKEFQDCITALEECEKPVIVAMHGYSLGLAIDLSSAADIRLCAADTKFAVKEVDIGLAADIGTLSRLPKVVGNASWMKEVCLSARFFGAEEALRVGFVSAVYKDKKEVLEKAVELASLIASKSPVAVQGTKELLNWSRDRTVADGLRYTTVWNSAALQTKDVQAALLSGLQKRKPTFEKL